jgi:hypothetical protein
MTKINKDEKLWLTVMKNDKPKYYVTSDLNRLNYYLYEVLEDGTLKKSKARADPMFPEVYG